MNPFRAIALAACAAVGLSLPLASHAQGKLEKPRVAIAVGGKAGFYYLPLTIAERLGYFKDEGLDVEISDFEGGSKALQAVVGGSADVVSGAWSQHAGLRAHGTVSGDLRRRGESEGGKLQIAQGSQGNEDRRQRSRFEYKPDGAASACKGRVEG